MTNDTLTTADRIAMLGGGGLILFGIAVLGLVNVLTNSPHVPVVEDGQVIATPAIAPEIRAYIIALGLVVWLLYGLFKLATAPGGDVEEEQTGVPA